MDPTLRAIDLAINPAKKSERQSKIEKEIIKYKSIFGNIDMEQAYEHFFELLWYSKLPCFDIKNRTSTAIHQMSLLKKCFWKDSEISCAALFKAQPTDRGMCCSFNMKEFLRTTAFSANVDKLKKFDKNNSFETGKLPDWYLQKEPKSQSGQNKGLRLILDAHSDILSKGTVFDDFQGFVTVVSDSENFPLTKKYGFLVKPGEETSVAIKPISIRGDESVRKLDIKDRNCYFQKESSLKLFKIYTQANCLFECQVDYARSEMNSSCTPWYYPGK